MLVHLSYDTQRYILWLFAYLAAHTGIVLYQSAGVSDISFVTGLTVWLTTPTSGVWVASALVTKP